MAKFDTLCQEVETLTGKKFKQRVPTASQRIEDFMKRVNEKLDEYLPKEISRRQSLTLARIGLIPKDYDLRQAYADLLKSQAGAYYDYDSKKVYILMSELPEAVLEPVIIHELTHVIQDQYYDLKNLFTRLKEWDEDKGNALSFLTEGQATYTMTLYSVKQYGMDPTQLNPAQLKQVFQTLAGMDRAALLAQNETLKNAFGDEAKEIVKAIDDLKNIPNYLFRTLNDPYLKGSYTIAQVLAQNGGQLDKLFEEPPDSTEQVLHPEKRLLKQRDYPVELKLPELNEVLGKDWELLFTDVLGELGFRILFEDYLKEKTKIPKIATGWDGDRYVTYIQPKTQKVLLTWFTTWDTEEDARQFFEGYQTLLKNKYPAGTSQEESAIIFNWELPNKEIATCEIKGKDVVLVESPKEMASQLRAGLFTTQKIVNPKEQTKEKE
jgi:hypothetical protein